jgi:hypothetical protein
MEVSLKGMLADNQTMEGEYRCWVSKYERSAQGMPRECIHVDDPIDITKRTPSRSRSNGLVV